MPGHQSIRIALTVLDQLAIGNDLHPFGHMAGDLAGETHVRVVIAWEPVAMKLRLTLCPKLRIPLLVAHLRCAEIEAVFQVGHDSVMVTTTCVPRGNGLALNERDNFVLPTCSS